MLDHLDRCPHKPGPVANHGCPDHDRDGDGLADRVDRCPDRFGLAAHNGCPPPDADGDGVPDARDRCKRGAEVYNGVRDTDGCPDRPAAVARLHKDRVEVVGKLGFVNRDRSLSRAGSYRLRIAAALLGQRTPGVVEVEVVAGYGLSYGDSMQRARRRAAAMVAALRKRLPKYTKLVAKPRGPDGKPRIVLRYH